MESFLKNIFRNDVDFYSEIAIRTEGLQGVSSDKAAPNFLGKVNKAARQKAKAYSLGLAYGMSPYKLKFELNCSEQEATRLASSYMTAFPDLALWIKQAHQDAQTRGYVKTEAGRMRHLEQVKILRKKWGSSIDHDLELYKMYHRDSIMYAKAKADRKVYKNLLNNSVNFLVQGLAATIVNQACIEIQKRLAGHKSRLVGAIHDEAILEVHGSELDWVPAMVKEVMETVYPLSVPLRVEPQLGDTYAECK